MVHFSSDVELNNIQTYPQTTLISNPKQYSIYVRNAHKRFGTKKHPVNVLNGLNMTVPKGTIYGLLGASGCGKTTLLNCIVGRARLESGEVMALGGTPGTKGCDVLGNKLGYMPQDLALYGEFTISETLKFYGWIADMKAEAIKQRTEFLVKLLMLPDANQKVELLSTGQQRRVSLAVALLHEPELLILDEPTVGVDFVLRQIIWDHFLDIVRDGRTSVVITTHYVDETRQASLIGLMRKGVLLAEQEPENLITQFNAPTLEDIFLRLSIAQNVERGRSSSLIQEATTSLTTPSKIVKSIGISNDELREITEGIKGSSLFKHPYSQEISHDKCNSDASQEILVKNNIESKAYSEYRMVCKFEHIKALMWKNYLWGKNHPEIMLFGLVMPFFQFALFFWCIGGFPKDLRVAVVNEETNNDLNCNSTISCNSTSLSCSYFNYLETRGLHLLYYDTVDDAVQSVLKGNNYASIVVKQNYSESLRKRLFKTKNIKDWDVEYSTVDVVRELSNKAMSTFVLLYLYESFFYFVRDIFVSCGFDDRIISLPIDIETLYGDKYPDFTVFVVPGAIVAVSFMAGIAMTASVLLIERSEGNLDRYYVTGIKGIELFVAHGLSQIGGLLYLTIATMLTTFVFFGMQNRGSYVLVILLQLLNSICGACAGFIISSFCKTEQQVLHIVTGTFLPVILLGGIIWPVEALHPWLKAISTVLPLSQSSESIRSLLHRGWGITHSSVYLGFISVTVWTIICIVISVLCIIYKRK